MDTTEDPKGILELQRVAQEARHAHEAITQKRQTKLEMIRLAKEVLAENARHQPTEYVPVTATAVIAFAEELIQYVGD